MQSIHSNAVSGGRQVEQQQQIPFGNDKQEEQEQRLQQQQIPFGNDKQEEQVQVQIALGRRQRKAMQEGLIKG